MTGLVKLLQTVKREKKKKEKGRKASPVYVLATASSYT